MNTNINSTNNTNLEVNTMKDTKRYWTNIAVEICIHFEDNAYSVKNPSVGLKKLLDWATEHLTAIAEDFEDIDEMDDEAAFDGINMWLDAMLDAFDGKVQKLMADPTMGFDGNDYKRALYVKALFNWYKNVAVHAAAGNLEDITTVSAMPENPEAAIAKKRAEAEAKAKAEAEKKAALNNAAKQVSNKTYRRSNGVNDSTYIKADLNSATIRAEFKTVEDIGNACADGTILNRLQASADELCNGSLARAARALYNNCSSQITYTRFTPEEDFWRTLRDYVRPFQHVGTATGIDAAINHRNSRARLGGGQYATMEELIAHKHDRTWLTATLNSFRSLRAKTLNENCGLTEKEEALRVETLRKEKQINMFLNGNYTLLDELEAKEEKAEAMTAAHDAITEKLEACMNGAGMTAEDAKALLEMLKGNKQ